MVESLDRELRSILDYDEVHEHCMRYNKAAFKEWREAANQDGYSIEADPQFANPEKGDFRLRSKSPCRRRGPKKNGKKTDIGLDWKEFLGKK